MSEQVAVNVIFNREDWKLLRRVAELHLVQGRASVRHVILRAVQELLAREAGHA